MAKTKTTGNLPSTPQKTAVNSPTVPVKPASKKSPVKKPRPTSAKESKSSVERFLKDILQSYVEKAGPPDTPPSQGNSVPPTTPASDFSFQQPIKQVPSNFQRLGDFELPSVRDIGIKSCIEKLSQFLGCNDYKLNCAQFWFLDVIVDCLWRAQDEFQFPEAYQKIIIEWMLFIFDVIRAPKMNLPRRKFLDVLTEMLLIAEEYIQNECSLLPHPSDLFLLEEVNDSEYSSFSETTTASISVRSSVAGRTDAAASYVEVLMGEDTNYYPIPKRECAYVDSELFVRSVEEFDIEGIPQEGEDEEEEYKDDVLESVEYYKPDWSTPDRFKSSSESSSSSSTILEDVSQSSSWPSEPEGITWKSSSTSMEATPCSSQIFRNKSLSTDDNLTKQLTSDKSETLVTNADTKDYSQEFQGPSLTELRIEFERYMDERKDSIKQGRKNIFVNCCAIFAIKTFVLDYFYDSFQFALVRLSFRTEHNLISQKLNQQWYVPKIITDELKRPKAKKEKKPKKPKKDKKKKKDKRSKKSKSSKKKKDKKKKGKKDKKPKKKKPTKEEKAELARLKKLQEALEEAMRRAEENRRLLLPLKEATDDEFFFSIFENWVKPKEKKAKGKKGKNK